MKKDLNFKDIYNFLPRFVAAGEVEYKDDKYLSPIERRFEWNHVEFGLVISPALITGQPDGDRYYFPGKTEQTVESALLELADPENLNFYEKESVLVVRLNFLLEVTSDLCGDENLTAGSIELSLHVLADTKYELSCGTSGFNFHTIEQLSRVEENGETYYRVRLASIAPDTGEIFDCLFGEKNLDGLGSESAFTF